MKAKSLIIIGMLIFTFAVKSNAQTDVNNAQAIFIYNFLSHIKWPDTDIGEKYVIGVIGRTSTLGYLKSYTKNRKIGTKSIEVRQINSPSEVGVCHVLLVAHNKNNLMPEITTKFNGKSCLIVSEKAGATDHGAVVDFHIVSGKLRYKINEDNAKAHNLFVSRALLTMSL
jgi:hypothetical protein